MPDSVLVRVFHRNIRYAVRASATIFTPSVTATAFEKPFSPYPRSGHRTPPLVYVEPSLKLIHYLGPALFYCKKLKRC